VTRVLTLTIVADGSSDVAFVPIVEWLLGQHTDNAFTVQLARGLPPPSAGLLQRVRYAASEYPCDVVVAHRDSEGRTAQERYAEMSESLADLDLRWIPVVPVRMTEAWLLLDKAAIRRASGNPNGSVGLALPPRSRWERDPNPKESLFRSLRVASELSGRRLEKFDVHAARFRLASLISDFSPLRGLPTFDRFESDLVQALGDLAS